MLNLKRVFKNYEDAGSLNAMVNLFGFVGSQVFLTKSGEVGVVLEIQGVDYECLDTPTVDGLTKRLESALRLFDENYRVYQLLFKRNRQAIPHSFCGKPVVDAAIMFEEMCKEFEKSHFASISENTIKGYQAYLKHLKVFFGEHVLTSITAKLVEEYRDHRRQQPSIRYKGRTLKGATVNRELECLTCVLDLDVQRKYIPENPARVVKHFNELRERPAKQMLTLEQENRILSAASPHLRVGIILLVQTGGRTYSEGFRLRWDQVDWENRLSALGTT
jgi:Phage integrase SAM-like domain